MASPLSTHASAAGATAEARKAADARKASLIDSNFSFAPKHMSTSPKNSPSLLRKSLAGQGSPRSSPHMDCSDSVGSLSQLDANDYGWVTPDEEALQLTALQQYQQLNDGSRRSSTASNASCATSGELPSQFVLSVIYRGKPTHHLIKRAGPGEPFFINNKQTDACTLQDLVKLLKEKQEWWPVVLTTPVKAILPFQPLTAEARDLLNHSYFEDALKCLEEAQLYVEVQRKIHRYTEAQYSHEMANIYDLMSTAHLGLDDPTSAKKLAQQAIDLEPEWWSPYSARANAERALELYDDAKASIRQADALLPLGDPRVSVLQRTFEEIDEIQQMGAKRISQERQLRITSTRRKSVSQVKAETTPELRFGEDMPDETIWYLSQKCLLCDTREPTLTTCSRCT